jgi:hypothetical protein
MGLAISARTVAGRVGVPESIGLASEKWVIFGFPTPISLGAAPRRVLSAPHFSPPVETLRRHSALWARELSSRKEIFVVCPVRLPAL